MKMIKSASILSDNCHECFCIYFVHDVLYYRLLVHIINTFLLKPILNIWYQSKHNIVVAKEALVLECVHIIVFGVKQIHVAFLNHVEKLKNVTFIYNHVIFVFFTNYVGHQLCRQSFWYFEVRFFIYK